MYYFPLTFWIQTPVEVMAKLQQDSELNTWNISRAKNLVISKDQMIFNSLIL